MNFEHHLHTATETAAHKAFEQLSKSPNSQLVIGVEDVNKPGIVGFGRVFVCKGYFDPAMENVPNRQRFG